MQNTWIIASKYPKKVSFSFGNIVLTCSSVVRGNLALHPVQTCYTCRKSSTLARWSCAKTLQSCACSAHCTASQCRGEPWKIGPCQSCTQLPCPLAHLHTSHTSHQWISRSRYIGWMTGKSCRYVPCFGNPTPYFSLILLFPFCAWLISLAKWCSCLIIT